MPFKPLLEGIRSLLRLAVPIREVLKFLGYTVDVIVSASQPIEIRADFHLTVSSHMKSQCRVEDLELIQSAVSGVDQEARVPPTREILRATLGTDKHDLLKPPSFSPVP
jgi:hypothetical protein